MILAGDFNLATRYELRSRGVATNNERSRQTLLDIMEENYMTYMERKK